MCIRDSVGAGRHGRRRASAKLFSLSSVFVTPTAAIDLQKRLSVKQSYGLWTVADTYRCRALVCGVERSPYSSECGTQGRTCQGRPSLTRSPVPHEAPFPFANGSKISTPDRTTRGERTTPEDTAHATAHPDPQTTTANMHKPQPPPPSHVSRRSRRTAPS